MIYNFKDSLDTQILLDDFIEIYTAHVDLNEEKRVEVIHGYYTEVFRTLQSPFDSQELIDIFTNITHYNISLHIPYIVFSNEIYSLKNLLISNIIQDKSNENVVKIITLIKEINNSVAHIYLIKYIDELASLNSVRRNSLADLVEKNLIQHYESHLLWLTDLALHIKDKEKARFPELDSTMCAFGQWLHNDAKQTIQNNSKYSAITKMHSTLHLFASKIYKILEKNEYHILITYLEKCELISLSIGTELALLDQVIINQKVAKDTLTGALNRYGLSSIFESQYELSLATSNPFILAMCDLDFFKQINDTYGHVAGDAVLTQFVDIVKKNLRNSDVIIRYGGEEFIIMLPAVKNEKGREVLENIRQEFEESSTIFKEQKIHATVSIGMMEIKPVHPFKKRFINDYIMIVDQNLYIAKDAGRNKIESC